jgi:hypothetical protein
MRNEVLSIYFRKTVFGFGYVENIVKKWECDNMLRLLRAIGVEGRGKMKYGVFGADRLSLPGASTTSVKRQALEKVLRVYEVALQKGLKDGRARLLILGGREDFLPDCWQALEAVRASCYDGDESESWIITLTFR